MPKVIDNQITSDGYTNECTIRGLSDSNGGYAVIANNPVYCQIEAGPAGQQQFSQEFPLNAAVAALQIQPHATGIRFRSRNKSQPAIVYAVLFAPGEPGIIGSTFTGTVSQQGNVSIPVTLPAASDTSFLFVWQNANSPSSPSPGVFTYRRVPYDNVVHDYAGRWNATTHQYEITTSGWWFVFAGAMLQDATAASDPLSLAIYVNGTLYSLLAQTELPVTGGNILTRGSIALPFSAGEIVEIQMGSRSGNNVMAGAGFASSLILCQLFAGG